jgi:hypothetical protein
MGWAIAVFVSLWIAAVALFWHAFLPPSQAPERGVSAPRPDPGVVEQFEALRREHHRAMSQFHRELAAAGSEPDAEILVEKHPGKQYFQRFLELAEKHPGHPICPHIVGYALVCAGPDITPEDHMRIKGILEQNRRLLIPFGSR